MGVVNYYHYSVYKLLFVNLRSCFAKPDAVEKKTASATSPNAMPNRLRLPFLQPPIADSNSKPLSVSCLPSGYLPFTAQNRIRCG